MKERINKFLKYSKLEINRDGGLIIGIKHGYSKKLVKLGFNLNEQRLILLFLEANPKILLKYYKKASKERLNKRKVVK